MPPRGCTFLRLRCFRSVTASSQRKREIDSTTFKKQVLLSSIKSRKTMCGISGVLIQLQSFPFKENDQATKGFWRPPCQLTWCPSTSLLHLDCSAQSLVAFLMPRPPWWAKMCGQQSDNAKGKKKDTWITPVARCSSVATFLLMGSASNPQV